MPELPEVEIVRKSLNKKISGKIINDVRVKNRNLRLKIPKNFETKLKRKKILLTLEIQIIKNTYGVCLLS